MDVLIDERTLLDDIDGVILSEILDLIESNKWHIHCSMLPLINRSVQPEFIAIAGLSVSMLSLLVSVANYIRGGRKDISNDELLKEIRAYLVLRGCNDAVGLNIIDLVNFTERNGMPSRLVVTKKDGDIIYLSFGVTKNRIWISGGDCDWRALSVE